METRVSKGYKGIGMDGLIARWYAGIRGKEMAEHRASAERIAKYLPGAGRILEIAPGPGYMTIELAKMGSYDITGVDISESFVRIATEKAREAGVKIDFRQGDAAALPFNGESFDLTCCSAAFKNFSQPVKAIEEMYRVLRPGGTALIYDLRPDISGEAIDDLVKTMGLNWLNAMMTRWSFKHFLTRRAYPKGRLLKMVESTSFRKGELREWPLEHELVLRK